MAKENFMSFYEKIKVIKPSESGNHTMIDITQLVIDFLGKKLLGLDILLTSLNTMLGSQGLEVITGSSFMDQAAAPEGKQNLMNQYYLVRKQTNI